MSKTGLTLRLFETRQYRSRKSYPDRNRVRLSINLLIFLIAVLCGVWSERACAALIVYTSESDFLNDVTPTRLIDFDVDAAGSPIAAGSLIDLQYNAWGVEFNPFNGGVPNALFLPPSHPQPPLSAPNMMRTVFNTGGGGGFEVQMGKPVPGIGMFLGDVQFPGSTLEAFDAGGQSLGMVDTFSILGDSPYEWKFLGVRSEGAGIAELEVVFAGNDFVTVDNLRVPNVAAVPLPAALPLFLAGLAGLGAAARKRISA